MEPVWWMAASLQSSKWIAKQLKTAKELFKIRTKFIAIVFTFGFGCSPVLGIAVLLLLLLPLLRPFRMRCLQLTVLFYFHFPLFLFLLLFFFLCVSFSLVFETQTKWNWSVCSENNCVSFEIGFCKKRFYCFSNQPFFFLFFHCRWHKLAMVAAWQTTTISITEQMRWIFLFYCQFSWSSYRNERTLNAHRASLPSVFVLWWIHTYAVKWSNDVGSGLSVISIINQLHWGWSAQSDRFIFKWLRAASSTGDEY